MEAVRTAPRTMYWTWVRREQESTTMTITWQPARLIPTSGINGQEEAERRATSALLAVMTSVREFGAALLRPLGAPAGQLEAFIEVPFKLEGRTVIPDGLVQCARGSRSWTALIEVKTGAGELRQDQVECYLDVARDEGFDAVLTISNEMSPAPGVHPVEVDKRKLKKVALYHLSWAEVLTVAVQQRVHRGVADPDQAWILGELIRYLEHPKSGAMDFVDMGAGWVPVRESIATGKLRLNDKDLPEVASRWEQLIRFGALRLGRELGADVQPVLSRKELADPSLRANALAQSLVERGVLTAAIRIPDAAGPITVTADLRAGIIAVSVDVDAPREGKATTRVNWLARQLKDAPDRLRVDAWAANARSSTSELLKAVREDPSVLIEDPKKDLRSFRVTALSPAGSKRGTGRGGFIDSVLAAVDGFYSEVVQNVRPWAPKAPQLPKGSQLAAETVGLELSPPIGDLEEEALTTDSDFEASAAEDDEASWPGGEAAAEGDGSIDVVETAGVSAAELVDWGEAQDKLDHERANEEGDGR